MAKFRKGESGNLSGRPSGAKNKATKETKEFFSAFVKANEGKMQGWLDRVAKRNPAKAIELILKASEFVYPKKRTIDVTSFEHYSNTDLQQIIDELKKTANATDRRRTG